MATTSHHIIREALLGRIQSGEWSLGSLIPGEIQLAEEYGCARTTVNRALRTLAEQGLVVRKRKGGTRVRSTPLRQAKLDIPIIREQVERTGQNYSHTLLTRRTDIPPTSVKERLHLSETTHALYCETLHLANDRPFAFETRWVNRAAVPDIDTAPLDRLSVNEWLVNSVPFSNGDVSFSAINADAFIAKPMDVTEGQALFLIDRTTWLDATFITTMKLYYHEGFQLHSEL